MECRQENRGYKLQTCFGRNLAGFPLDHQWLPVTLHETRQMKGDKRTVSLFQQKVATRRFNSYKITSTALMWQLGWQSFWVDSLVVSTQQTHDQFSTHFSGLKVEVRPSCFIRGYPTLGLICTTSSRQLSANNRGFSNCKADAEKLQMTCEGHWVNVTQSAQTNTCTTRGSTRCQADW